VTKIILLNFFPRLFKCNYQLRVRWPTVVSRTLPVTRRIGQPQAVSVARISCSCWPGQATSSVVVHVSTANISQYPGRKHHLHNRETPCRAESPSSRSPHIKWHTRTKNRKTRERNANNRIRNELILKTFFSSNLSKNPIEKRSSNSRVLLLYIYIRDVGVRWRNKIEKYFQLQHTLPAVRLEIEENEIKLKKKKNNVSNVPNGSVVATPSKLLGTGRVEPGARQSTWCA